MLATTLAIAGCGGQLSGDDIRTAIDSTGYSVKYADSGYDGSGTVVAGTLDDGRGTEFFVSSGGNTDQAEAAMHWA